MTEIDYEATENIIRDELLECRRLFTRAVTDMPEYSTQEKIGHDFPGFQREVFKAHKYALRLLIDRILWLENLLAETTGATHPRSPDMRTLKLHFWKRILEMGYNTFVWIHVGIDRSNTKKVFKGPKHGDLGNQNVASVLQYVDEVNKNPNEFALPLDFCSFSPICDILQISYSEAEKIRRTLFLEAKSGKVNDEMLETIDAKTPEAYFKFFDTYGEKGINQMERFFRQQLMLHKSHKLINAESGVYENPVSGKPPLIVLPNEAKVVHFTDKITELLEKAERRDFAVDVIDNCLVVGALNGEDESILMLGEYDVRLYIYHCFFNPATLDGAPYPDDLPEILSRITLTDWLESVASVVLEPILLRRLADKYLMDVLLGKKRLRLFFNPESFITLCNENGIRAEFTTTKEANHLRSSGSAKGLVEFNGRFIRLFLGDAVATFGDGFLHEMLFNWVRPTSVIEQLKGHKLTRAS
ncbi:MAG: hypothetical protein AB1521_11985 [Bacteroidota bacterium]